MKLQKDGIHMLRANEQNEINFKLTAENDGLITRKEKATFRTCDSGFAAERLKVLQTKTCFKKM
jgi:hypothetical protein